MIAHRLACLAQQTLQRIRADRRLEQRDDPRRRCHACQRGRGPAAPGAHGGAGPPAAGLQAVRRSSGAALHAAAPRRSEPCRAGQPGAGPAGAAAHLRHDALGRRHRPRPAERERVPRQLWPRRPDTARGHPEVRPLPPAVPAQAVRSRDALSEATSGSCTAQHCTADLLTQPWLCLGLCAEARTCTCVCTGRRRRGAALAAERAGRPSAPRARRFFTQAPTTSVLAEEDFVFVDRIGRVHLGGDTTVVYGVDAYRRHLFMLRLYCSLVFSRCSVRCPRPPCVATSSQACRQRLSGTPAHPGGSCLLKLRQERPAHGTALRPAFCGAAVPVWWWAYAPQRIQRFGVDSLTSVGAAQHAGPGAVAGQAAWARAVRRHLLTVSDGALSRRCRGQCVIDVKAAGQRMACHRPCGRGCMVRVARGRRWRCCACGRATRTPWRCAGRCAARRAWRRGGRTRCSRWTACRSISSTRAASSASTRCAGSASEARPQCASCGLRASCEGGQRCPRACPPCGRCLGVAGAGRPVGRAPVQYPCVYGVSACACRVCRVLLGRGCAAGCCAATCQARRHPRSHHALSAGAGRCAG